MSVTLYECPSCEAELLGSDQDCILKHGMCQTCVVEGRHQNTPESWGAVPMLMDQLMGSILPQDSNFLKVWDDFRDETGMGGDHLWIAMTEAGNSIDKALNKHFTEEECEAYGCGVIIYEFQEYLNDRFDLDHALEAEDILRYWGELTNNADTIVKEFLEQSRANRPFEPVLVPLNELPENFKFKLSRESVCEYITTDVWFPQVEQRLCGCLANHKPQHLKSHRDVWIFESIPEDFDALADSNGRLAFEFGE